MEDTREDEGTFIYLADGQISLTVRESFRAVVQQLGYPWLTLHLFEGDELRVRQEAIAYVRPRRGLRSRVQT